MPKITPINRQLNSRWNEEASYERSSLFRDIRVKLEIISLGEAEAGA